MTDQQLGRYRILEKLGAGGNGIVYRAHDPTLDRDVAVKTLHPHVLENSNARKRFVNEALYLSRLNHPHICTVYEIGEENGQTFIAMEYVKGEVLSSLIPRDGLPLETLLRYGTQIADALTHAHQNGLIHRDLKVANVVVTPDANAKVLDFGLAKRVDPASAATQTDTVSGTPAYMAPEVLAGAEADHRADIWALGVILFEMASGERPFIGNTAPSLMSAILKDPPRELPSRIPYSVRQIIQRCLAKEPAERYQSASEVRAALQTASAGGFIVQEAVPHAPRRPRVLAASIAIAVVIALAVVTTFFLTKRGSENLIQSIAVLPLENLSGDAEQEYFADGMTEQLTVDLSSIGGLRVISRTSSMQYKKARKSLPEIARELNVDAVLEGTVVRAGDKVRITAKLIRGLTNENLWAKSYERDLGDVLALQSEVARDIATEIDIRITPQEQAHLSRNRRIDPVAQQQYFMGRHHFDRGLEDGLKKSIPYFEQAIAKDPSYAEAYAGLADTYVMLASNYQRPHDVMPMAKSNAEKALRLDNTLADAHAAMGFIHLFYDWDGPAAERELTRAIELNPSSAAARINHAGYYLATGKREEAVPEIRKAVQLDPLSLRTQALGIIFLIFALHYDEAIEQARKAQELEPRFGPALAFQGLAFAEQGRFKEALESLEKAALLDKSAMVSLFRAHVHAVAGNKDHAKKLVNEIEEEAEIGYMCPYEVATAYVSLRDNDKAYEWLRKGIHERADCMAWLGVEPWMEPFRADPRYNELLREIGLATSTQTKPTK
jgi:serine/threonine-protein kinase